MRKECRIISKNNNRPIAFFDSGVGGLTVYTKLRALLPEENYIYFGDTKHMPYGEKTETELLEYADNIFRFFESKNAKAVVMACNTTSSVIYDKVKDKYNFKIYPVIQSAAKILSQMNAKTIGVFATKATVNTNGYKREIQKYNRDINVVQIACPEWVRIVEEHRVNAPQSILQVKEKLDEMAEFKPDKIVLGCTHYPYLLKVLSKFVPEEVFVDPAIHFAQFIKDDLEAQNMLSVSDGTEEFYVSEDPQNFKDSAKMFYDLKDLPKLALN